VIHAGTAREVPVSVEVGNIVEWTFQTEGGDVGFGILLERPDGVVETLVEKDRVPSDEESIRGSMVMEHKGRLWLQWDNTYSWLTNKQLIYSVSLQAEQGAGEASVVANGGENGHVATTQTSVQGPPSVVFVLGGPGSGKGTQCDLLSKEFGFVFLSAGDLLRAERSNPDSKDGALIEAYIKEGKIVPIEITVKLLVNAMKALPSKCYLIDGFPRNQDNLDGWLRETRDTVNVLGVLFFDCPEDVLVGRLLERGKTSGRADDNEESIRKRLVTFRNDTMPIVEHFEKQGHAWKINTNRNIDTIFSELKALLEKLVFKGDLNATLPVPSVEQVAEAPVTETPVVEKEVVLPTQPAQVDSQQPVVISPVKSTKKPLRVILGTMTIGGQADKAVGTEMINSFVSSKCVRAHLTAGKAELDTARMYQAGKTEKILGELLGAREDLRRTTLVATKANPFPMAGKTLRKESVIAQLNESLEALGTKSADIFYLHAPDHATKIEVTLEAVQELYEEGRFREFGLSNYAAWETVQIYYICKERGYVLPTVYQGMYNAITREVEKELLPALKALGMRFYAYNPLAGGFLTGKHRRDQVPGDGRFGGDSTWAKAYRNRFWKAEYFDALDLIFGACKKANISMANASIRWVMHHSALSGSNNDGIIIGSSTLGHLEDNLEAASEGPLPEGLVNAFQNAWEVCKPACPSYNR